MNNEYKPNEIEAKWQKEWENANLYSPDIKEANASAGLSTRKPFYNLMMFPYPSAEGLHVGNMYAFTGADVFGRFQRMKGKDVFEPIGLDGFGIHSENYAMKVGRHPKEQAQIAETNFYRQLKSIGNSFDWQRTIETYDPDYYRWTQWLFIQLFKNGLAYRKKAQVNWCPSDKTVLSDEQVIDGKCERCNSVVEKRELEQWFFRITKYADRLLNNLSQIDWVEKVKIAQKQWIGKSEGAELNFEVESTDAVLTVFTTRPDTLYGVTFMAISPEHELVNLLLSSRISIQSSNLDEIKGYIIEAKKKSDRDRTEGKEKTGVFTGLYAINPVNSKKIPIYVADYVLAGYGTGAIMAVPAHDQRDFEFAKKYNLPIVPVIQQSGVLASSGDMESAFEGKGEIIGSEDWNGFHAPDDMDKVLTSLESKRIGSRRSNYHLRDWLISRQRYWGPPIPMIYCESCFKNNKGEREDMAGWYSVEESHLPVLLPDVKDWKPMGTGKSPLANHPEFYEVKCPSCGDSAIRETDVSDTFLDSAWYFLRYPSIDIENKAFDTEITKKWLPVDMYIGGAEHSVLHLLYARFVTMVLKDLNFIDFEEPFTRFFAHGLIIKDGAKMSKSKGNVVVPDEYIKKYGADALRTYLMFLGPYEDGGAFTDSGIDGMYRFLKRVWRLISEAGPAAHSPHPSSSDSLRVDDGAPQFASPASEDLNRIMHKTIKGVTKDLENLSYNTAIAKLMEYYNGLSSYYIEHKSLDSQYLKTFLLLLAPFAPHMTEELWQRMNQESGIKNQQEQESKNHDSLFITHNSIHKSSWPEFDENLTQDSEATIIIQVNGKKRGEITMESSKAEAQDEIEKLGKEQAKTHLDGKEIKKIIYVKGKILNFVIS